MNDLRTAAQQALEAMEEACEIIGAAWAWRDEKGKPTITALRAALVQQAEPVQEPKTDPKPMSPEQRQRWEELAAMPQQAEPNVEYERGFIDGMQKQAQSSVDRAVNRMAEQATSVAFQYRREQVAKQMAGVYTAFGASSSPARAGSAQQVQAHVAEKRKG